MYTKVTSQERRALSSVSPSVHTINFRQTFVFGSNLKENEHLKKRNWNHILRYLHEKRKGCISLPPQYVLCT
jgi:hypothetical protein